jgi:nitroreductase
VDAKLAATDHPVHELVRARWSPYGFSEEPVPDEVLRSLFEAARWAPSSFNEQPWRYIVATRGEPAEFERLLSCLVEANQAWAKAAPVLALGVAKRTFTHNGKPNKVAHHDLGLAAGSLLLEATARNILVHQMGGILPERARELYAIPDDAEALTALAIGYLGAPEDLPEDLAERDRAPRTRKPLHEFVFSGRWGRAASIL